MESLFFIEHGKDIYHLVYRRSASKNQQVKSKGTVHMISYQARSSILSNFMPKRGRLGQGEK
jgi:hypothetical protein